MMQKWIVVAAVLLMAAVTAETTAADDGSEPTTYPCVTVYTEPPDAAVNPGCVFEIIDDLPPGP